MVSGTEPFFLPDVYAKPQVKIDCSIKNIYYRAIDCLGRPGTEYNGFRCDAIHFFTSEGYHLRFVEPLSTGIDIASGNPGLQIILF